MRKWWIFFIVQVLSGLLFKIMAAIGRVTFRLLFFTISTEKAKNIAKVRKPIIVVANHKTYFDPFFLIAAALFHNTRILPARGVGADWLFKILPLRLFIIHLFGGYPARKGQGLEVSLRDPLRILAKGHTVALYPEGGIRPAQGIHQIKRGAAYLAQKSGVPIYPMAIRGVENFSERYLGLKDLFFGGRKITVVFGEPFSIGPDEDLETASEKIGQRIAELYEPR